MSRFPKLTYHWTILCFLGLFNECIIAWSGGYPEINRSTSRHRYISRTWSDWTIWSSCSRTCGGGIRQRTRVCRVRTVGYQVSPNTCVGDTIEYELCSRNACSPNMEDFLEYQCSKKNGQVIAGKEISEWIPYQYGRNPCELQCWSRDRSLVYSFGKVIDGTSCPSLEPKDPALCVNGRCMLVDCAGYLGKHNRRDKCGVCRGNNTTCVKVQNTFWGRPRDLLNSDGRKDRYYDYNEIFSIPAGATHIYVSENSDRNFLVLVDHRGNFIVNGNWRVQSPGKVLVHGSEFIYNRTWDGHEQIRSDGPTKHPLKVLVLGSSDIPDVHYEYWISTISQLPKPYHQETLYRIKLSDSQRKRTREDSETYQLIDNSIESSSQTRPPPPTTTTKSQGYNSYYHRNEILKSVPSWSIKRHKRPMNRSYVPIQKDLRTSQEQNQTHDPIRHFENSMASASIAASKLNKARPSAMSKFRFNDFGRSNGSSAYTSSGSTTLSPFSLARLDYYNITKEQYKDFGRPNRTSSFSRLNRLVTEYENRPAIKQAFRSKGGSKNEDGSKKRSVPKKRTSKRTQCPPCPRSRHQTRNFCISDFVLRAIALSAENQNQSTRIELEVIRSYKNKIPIMSREYIWTPSTICQCPKLRVGKEYILMGRSSIGKRESRLIVDRGSFVRQYTEKRGRTMLKLVRDQNTRCRAF